MLETKRKLIKFSNYSFCITLPKEAIDHMGWKKGDTLAVVFDDSTGKITVVKGKGDKGKDGRSGNNHIPAKKPAAKSAAANSMSSDIQPIPKLRW